MPAPPPGPFLLFTHEFTADLAAGLVARLREWGECVTVLPGGGFAELDDGVFAVRPDQPADFERLIARLAATDRLPRSVVHLWGVTGADPDPIAPATLRRHEALGFHSVSALGRALADRIEGEVHLTVVTDHLQDVDGSEDLAPGKAAVLGASIVLPQEYGGLTCATVDFAHVPREGWTGPPPI